MANIAEADNVGGLGEVRGGYIMFIYIYVLYTFILTPPIFP